MARDRIDAYDGVEQLIQRLRHGLPSGARPDEMLAPVPTGPMPAIEDDEEEALETIGWSPGQVAGVTDTLPDGRNIVGMPDRIGRYRVDRELGQGRMGIVIEAYDPVLGRSVAIKVVSHAQEAEHDAMARFLVEARLAAQLAHPGLIPVHDIGVTEEGLFFLVMEKVEGRTLEQTVSALQRGDPAAMRKWTLPRLIAAIIQVCRTVGHAHRHRVVHRDLTPASVLLGDHDEVMVLDWRLARVPDTPDHASRRPLWTVVDDPSIPPSRVRPSASPGYAAPELALPSMGAVDARSDVFSLGAILYRAISLRRPWPGMVGKSLLHEVVSGPPQDPIELAPERAIPPAVSAVALSCMRPDRLDRPADGLAVAEALEAALLG
jgi:eukaryotic-like serine/threonine-protein kinase